MRFISLQHHLARTRGIVASQGVELPPQALPLQTVEHCPYSWQVQVFPQDYQVETFVPQRDELQLKGPTG